ncbi:MAG: hypothetical protein ACK5N4_23495 [Parabacteroides gordonii]|uniref:hypothetical protein n=1 Tax=Parabacteroides TaxID=375288 RepID=UPI001CCAB03B|nr:hypothetical protein [Parabacteroides goldsteinii]UBD75683.1 hypothetical protein K6V26_04890 [Parabacteroides goldsteinii]
MKALIILLIAPVMMMFTLGGIQTIEWCLENGIEIPWQVYALLVCVAIWCVAAIGVTKEDWHKVNRLFDRLTGE